MPKQLKSLTAAVLASVAILLSMRESPQAAAGDPPVASPVATADLGLTTADFLADAESLVTSQRPLIGKPAPAFTVGKWMQHGVDLSPAATKGKVVILDIWATYCLPCIKELPETDALAKKYAGKDVVFASVCTDSDEPDVVQFLKDHPLDLPMATDTADQSVYKAFAGNFLPTYVAIDRAGTIRAIGYTHDAMQKILDKLLAEPAK